MKFSINDFFGKCDPIRRKLRIWSHLVKKSVMKNFYFFVQGNVIIIKNLRCDYQVFKIAFVI